MRDRHVRIISGGQLAAGTDNTAAWLELSTLAGSATMLELTESELMMTVQTLAMVYADLCGANPDSLARSVDRALRNRTRAARQRRAQRRTA